MRLVQSTRDIFGQVTPPTTIGTGDPVAELGRIIGTGVQIFLSIAGLFLLLYMSWGAFDWIVSSGEKERVEKARNKITNALIGILLIFVVLAIFGLLAGDLLGIVKRTPQGWEFNVPTLR